MRSMFRHSCRSLGKAVLYMSAVLVLAFSIESVAAQLTARSPLISGPPPRATTMEGRVGALPDGVEVPVWPEPFTPSLGTSFNGPNFDENAAENGGTLFIPPDPHGAVGPDRVVAVVNVTLEIRDKMGGLICRDALSDLFATTPGAGSLGTFTFDPKVIYDPYEDRFVVVTLEQEDANPPANQSANNRSRILLAVSTNATPGCTVMDWHLRAINSKTLIGGVEHWADYPGFEVDEEAVYVAANMFSHVAGALGGVRLWIINKGVVGGLYDGGVAAFTTHNPYASAGIVATTQPCQVFGASGVGPGIGTFLVSYDSLTFGGPGANEVVQVVRVDDPLGTPAFTQEFVNIGDIEDVGGVFGFPDLPDAPQSGTGTLIEVNDSRALDCVWRNNQLYITTTINPNSGPDAGETTAHWFQLDTSSVPGAAITLVDQGDIGGEDIAVNTSTFFPAIAVDGSNNVGIGFAASAATIFPGAFYTGRQPGDPAGTVQASETLATGVDFYVRTFGLGRNRWGDYSGIAVDPTDDATFWVFNEYAIARGTETMMPTEDGRWGTRWGSFSFSVVQTCQGEAATIVGTTGRDILMGTPARDVIVGLEGHDVIYGGGGNDLICGGPGNDILIGGDGRDRLYGESGSDVLEGGLGDDKLFGDIGNDFLFGQEGNDSLFGQGGNDFLDGGDGDDELRGSGGPNDVCDGGTGTDTNAGGCEMLISIP